MGSDAKLDEIIGYLKELNSKVETTEARLVKQINEIMQHTGQEMKKIREENKYLLEKIEDQEKRIIELEDLKRKNNVVIFGMNEDEQNELELEKNVKALITDDLNLDITNVDINNVFRMGKKQEQPRPIMLACTTWRLKKEIMKNKKNMKNRKIIIKEDFSPEMRAERKQLGIVMMELRETGKRVSVRGNKLFMEGKYYAKEEIEKIRNHITVSPLQSIGLNERQRSGQIDRQEPKLSGGRDINLENSKNKTPKIASFFGARLKPEKPNQNQ